MFPYFVVNSKNSDKSLRKDCHQNSNIPQQTSTSLKSIKNTLKRCLICSEQQQQQKTAERRQSKESMFDFPDLDLLKHLILDSFLEKLQDA